MGQVLSPGATLVGQLMSAGGALASQIKQHSERRRIRRRGQEPAAEAAPAQRSQPPREKINRQVAGAMAPDETITSDP